VAEKIFGSAEPFGQRVVDDLREKAMARVAEFRNVAA
jgi:hypothetical protein